MKSKSIVVIIMLSLFLTSCGSPMWQRQYHLHNRQMVGYQLDVMDIVDSVLDAESYNSTEVTGQIDALIDLQAGVVEQMKNISVLITRKRSYNRIIEAHEKHFQNQQVLNYGFKTGELVLVLGALDLIEMDDGMRQLLEQELLD